METDVSYWEARKHSIEGLLGVDLSRSLQRNVSALTLTCMLSLFLSSSSPWFLAGGIFASTVFFIYFCIVDWKTSNLLVAGAVGPSGAYFESSIDDDGIRESCTFPKNSDQEKSDQTSRFASWEAVSHFYYDENCSIAVVTNRNMLICVDSRLISLNLRKKIEDRLIARGALFGGLQGTVQHLKKKHKRFFVEVVLLWLFFIFWGSFVYYLNSLLE